MATTITSDSLPFSTLIHMITLKLSSTKFLLWRQQFLSLLTCHGLIGYVDGSRPPPDTHTRRDDGSSIPNPAYLAWKLEDQKLMNLLFSTLTEEAMAISLGCKSSRAVWLALESAYSHSSKARELRLKDELQLFKKGI